MEDPIDRVALNAKMSSGSQTSSAETKMVAFASCTTIRLWAITDDGQRNDIGIKINYFLFVKQEHFFTIPTVIRNF